MYNVQCSRQCSRPTQLLPLLITACVDTRSHIKRQHTTTKHSLTHRVVTLYALDDDYESQFPAFSPSVRVCVVWCIFFPGVRIFFWPFAHDRNNLLSGARRLDTHSLSHSHVCVCVCVCVLCGLKYVVYIANSIAKSTRHTRS